MKPGVTLPFDFSPRSTGEEAKAEEGGASPPTRAAEEVLTVAELGRRIRSSVDRAFDRALWVEGEVTGARPAATGHLYFCIKDEKEEAAIDVVIYRSNVTPRTRTLVRDGARVRLRGRPTVWTPRGRLQLVAERAEPAGRGALLEALEKLKEKLMAEGLFSPERKRALPHEPRIVGVVTSDRGAVIHDICRVASRRVDGGALHILLAPAEVQGTKAPESIRRALAALQRVAEVDVIVIGRGGGSADDLSAFNDELVVRAVAAARVPVVSAVGHEVDVTLPDFAADARAATPSQAAELVIPDARARRALLAERNARLVRAIRGRLAEHRASTERLSRRLGDPRIVLANAQQRLDDRTTRLEGALGRQLRRKEQELAKAQARLGPLHPQAVIARERDAIVRAAHRLDVAMRDDLARRRALTERLVRRFEANVRGDLPRRRGRFESLLATLDALSPFKVLARGYAIASRNGRAIRAAREVSPGDILEIRFERGAAEAQIIRVDETSLDPGDETGTDSSSEPESGR